MPTTNLSDYLAHLPDSDLDTPIRVVFEATQWEDLEIQVKKLTLSLFFRLPLSNLGVAEGSGRLIQQLVSHPGVQKAWKDQMLFLCSQHVLDAIGISSLAQSWLKPSGKGVRIALLDSGIDSTHPDLHDTIVSRKSFLREENNTDQLNPHGTAMAGIIGGIHGIAKAVDFIDAQVFNQAGVAFLSEVVEALIWTGTQEPNLILLGGVTLPGFNDDNPLVRICQKIIATGTTIIAPAGNFGPESGTLGCPAWVPGVIAVGAVTLDGDIAFFSSRGDSKIHPLKPDIVLPGVGLQSVSKIGDEIKSENITGTSVAAAICTGLIALILSGRKNVLSPDLTNAILHAAENIDQDPVSQGNGILNGLTLARQFDLLHTTPDPFKRIVSSSIILTSIVTAIVIVASIAIYLFW